MSEDKSAFEILGIDPGDDFATARKRYRKLARLFHPDRRIGDPVAERKFREVQNAWDAIRHRLPKDIFPFPADADDPNFDDQIGQWLLSLPDNNAEAPRPAPSRAAWAPATGSSVVSRQDAMKLRELRDWRTQVVSGLRAGGMSLANIDAQEAKRLYDAFPNSFAALGILQRERPDLCLHDAIKACFDPMSLAGAATEPKQWRAALSDPLASIQHATEYAGGLAPYMHEGRSESLNPKKLALDLWCLKCCVEELAPKVSKRPGPPGSAVTVRW